MRTASDEAVNPALPSAALEDWAVLQERVANVRRRHRLKFAARGLLLGLTVLAAAFLGFSLADVLFKLSVPSRVAWCALAWGGLAGVLFLTVLVPWSRLGGLVRCARDVEGAFPQLENQLSTTLEYGGEARLIAVSSPELVGALVQQTQQRTAPLDFTRTIRWRAVAWASGCERRCKAITRAP